MNLFVKSENEIESLRASAKHLARILDEVLAMAKPGVSTWELDQAAEQRMRAMRLGRTQCRTGAS